MKPSGLGLDFWLFRSGQIVSRIGVNCRSIALSWWVLEKTGSATQMAAVLTPALIAHMALLPLLGPLADRWPRKKLLAFGDGWRGLMMLILAVLVACDLFNLYALIVIQVLSAAGTALAEPSYRSIVPQIVLPEHLPKAIRVTQIVDAGAGIAGGLLGGAITSLAGIKGAFVFDGLTFLLAAACSLRLRASTVPLGSVPSFGAAKQTAQQWARDLAVGFQYISKNHGLLGLGLVAMLLNLAFSPLSVALPILIKEARQMPPWFLGVMDAAFGIGAVLGAVLVMTLRERLRADLTVVIGLGLIGLGIVAIPFVPTILLPGVMVMGIGLGCTLANLPMETQIALSVPDGVRARVNAAFLFLCGVAMPLGTALSGVCIERLGLNRTLWGIGTGMLLAAPVFALVPSISDFMRGIGQKSGERPSEWSRSP